MPGCSKGAMAMDEPSALDGIVIRQVVEDDLPHLLCEENAVYLRFMFQSAFDSMRRGEQLLWVAEHVTDGIIGQLIVQFNSMRAQLADGTRRAYFYSFRVHPQWRRRGVGSYLLQHLEEDLRQRGFRMLTLTVEKNNEAARRLYERHGYHVVGTEMVNRHTNKVNGRWQEAEELAWRMEKQLF